MGYDDDRIRSKNSTISSAFDMYDGLHAMGYSAEDIKAYAKHNMATETNFYRNEIYLEVINIAGRSDEKGNCST